MCCVGMEQRATTRYMTDHAPAAPLHAAIEAALDEMGRDKVWLSREARLARSTINGWKTNPNAPRAASVNRVADALGMGREEARRLAGLSGPQVIAAEEEAVTLSEVDTDALLAEIRRRILG